MKSVVDVDDSSILYDKAMSVVLDLLGTKTIVYYIDIVNEIQDRLGLHRSTIDQYVLRPMVDAGQITKQLHRKRKKIRGQNPRTVYYLVQQLTRPDVYRID